LAQASCAGKQEVLQPAADLPVVGEISCHLSRFAAVTRSSAAKIVVRYSW